MKHSKVKIILIVVFAVIAVIVSSLLFSQLGPTRRTLTKTYTIRPSNLQEAKRACPIDLPNSARNIQFFKYGAFMATMRLVKFEAPVEQCILHAKIILSDFEKKTDYPNFKELIPIIKDKKMDKEYLIGRFGDESLAVDFMDKYKQKYTGPFSVEWFDPYNIKNGLEGGCAGSHSPQVWIDVERGIFYYRYTD